jgi:Arc/MetJ-type ribon-helix-helix transcriptional regulator
MGNPVAVVHPAYAPSKQTTFVWPRVQLVPNCIPIRYHLGMTIQIAVRLPDDIVAFVDEQVSSGAATSRAAVVARALEHERRRAAAERDAAIYQAAARPHDFDELATWTAAQPIDID